MKQQSIEKPILIIVGPTAIGKTELSIAIARQYNAEIVSVDSMQVYRYMDIGTAKASYEERSGVPHHLIDIVNPDESYDAARFAEDARKAITDIHTRDKMVLLTGGTGLYLRALLYGIFSGVPTDSKVRKHLVERLQRDGASKLHEELNIIDRISAERININDTQRLLRALEVYYISGISWSDHIRKHQLQSQGSNYLSNICLLGLTCDRSVLYERIDRRCRSMLENGLEGEVDKLLKMGYSRDLKPFSAIGYRHMIDYIDRKTSWEDMLRLLSRDTRRYAKRQYTWFSKMENLSWFHVLEKERIIDAIDSWLTDNVRAVNAE